MLGSVDTKRDPEGFSKVYEKGWQALASLAGDAASTRLYVFLAAQAGHDNSVICTYSVMSQEIGLSERTIRRSVRRLEEGGHLVVLKVGSAQVYVLNPDEVWKTAHGYKRFCAFHSRVLVPFSDNPTLKKRITHLFQGRLDLKEVDA